jgi:hypothetical protein
MCPQTQFMYLAFAAVIIYSVFVYRKLFQVIAANFDTLGALLASSQRKRLFYKDTLTGFYKGRRVEFQCLFFEKGNPRTLSLEPKVIPNRQKKFMLSYPRPTRNTQWKGTKVVYSPAGFFRTSESYYTIYSKDEFVRMLDELSEAAQQVEAGGATAEPYKAG